MYVWALRVMAQKMAIDETLSVWEKIITADPEAVKIFLKLVVLILYL